MVILSRCSVVRHLTGTHPMSIQSTYFILFLIQLFVLIYTPFINDEFFRTAITLRVFHFVRSVTFVITFRYMNSGLPLPLDMTMLCLRCMYFCYNAHRLAHNFRRALTIRKQTLSEFLHCCRPLLS